jgi:hypothetical protein
VVDKPAAPKRPLQRSCCVCLGLQPCLLAALPSCSPSWRDYNTAIPQRQTLEHVMTLTEALLLPGLP